MNRLFRTAASTTGILLAMHVGSSSLLMAQILATPVPVNLNSDQAMHVANRLTMGQTQALVTSLTGPTTSALAWITSQLAPNFAIENADVAPMLAGIGVPTAPIVLGSMHDFTQLSGGVHVYGAISNWQLAARMGYFWDRHFNTFGPGVSAYIKAAYSLGDSDAQSIASRIEWIDYDFYRRNGLGLFRDLARQTAYSPVMMIYLDTVANRCDGAFAPNQNMAREFMELHTIDTDYLVTGLPNYSASDLDKVSRIFAGWRLSGNGHNIPFTPVFDPTQHCSYSGPIFGTAGVGVFNPTSGQTALDQLIDHLCGSAACKDFICRKLMNEFLGDGSDVVYPTVLNNMKAQWGALGNLSAVLNSLFSSGAFLTSVTKWTRAKTPHESSVSHMRTWNGSFRHPVTLALEPSRVNGMVAKASAIGESLFQFQTPDGFALESNQQPGSSVTLETSKLFSVSYYDNSVVPSSAPPGTPPYARGVNFPIAAWVTTSLGAANTNPVAIGTLFLNRAYGSKWTTTDLAAVTQALSVDVNGVTAPLNPALVNQYAERLGQGVMATMSMNQALLR